MLDGLADPAPIHPDISGVRGTDLPQDIDGMAGGFPCQAWPSPECFSLHKLSSCGQGISRAGAQEGMMDHRSGLLRELWRLWDERAEMGCPLNLE